MEVYRFKMGARIFWVIKEVIPGSIPMKPLKQVQ